jgi:threonine dehydrogenase-like Zn-dependent dehydrogenase
LIKERAAHSSRYANTFTREKIMPSQSKPLAVVTGASTGIGYELAKCCASAGLLGIHLLGGYPGGQAEYLRSALCLGPIKVPNGLSDVQVLFLSDIFPTGYMAADFCNIQPGDTIAIWGCGPVGQFAIRSALLLGQGAS